MNDLILHHHAGSPFAEEARLMLGFMLALGHGRATAMSSTEALAVAAGAAALAPVAVQPGLGFEACQALTVTPTDHGMDPVAGTLVGLSGDEVVLARSDPRAGRVQVHFPRAGFQIKQEKQA